MLHNLPILSNRVSDADSEQGIVSLLPLERNSLVVTDDVLVFVNLPTWQLHVTHPDSVHVSICLVLELRRLGNVPSSEFGRRANDPQLLSELCLVTHLESDVC